MSHRKTTPASVPAQAHGSGSKPRSDKMDGIFLLWRDGAAPPSTDPFARQGCLLSTYSPSAAIRSLELCLFVVPVVYQPCTLFFLESSLVKSHGVGQTGPEPPLLGSLSSQTPSCCPLPDLKIHLMHPSLPVVALLPFQPLSLLLPLRRRRLGLCRLPLLILVHV